MPDPELQYTFTCPSCAGTSSIRLEKIPPVQARFPCPHCQRPMDFPSREEARIYAQLQVQNAAAPTGPPSPRRETPAPRSLDETGGVQPGEASRFQVEKRGFESDVFDRRGIRNLIRTGQVSEDDRVRVDQGEPARAGNMPYLKSLFELRKNARGTPPSAAGPTRTRWPS